MSKLYKILLDEVSSLLKNKFETAWMDKHEKIIAQEIDQEINVRKELFKQRRKADFREDKYDDSKVNTFEILININNKYLEKFKELYESDLKRRIEKTFEGLIYPTLLEQLYHRHPWIEPELQGEFIDYTALISYHFLKNIAYDRLRVTAEWDWREVEQFGKRPESILLKPQVVEAYIEGYPLSNISIYKKRLNLYSLAYHKGSLNFVNFKLRRIDIFRLIQTEFSRYWECSIDSNEENSSNLFKGEPAMTRIAPYLLDEVSNLSKQQWKYLNTILVNIGTEDEPDWICASRKADTNRWTLYVPDYITTQQKKSLETVFANNKAQITFHQVNSNTNHALDDLDKLSPLGTWQGILFARILPWVIKSPDITLEDYRKDVPLYALINNAFMSCLSDFETKVMNECFVCRFPLSDKKLNEIFSRSHLKKALVENAELTFDRVDLEIIKALENNELNVQYDPDTNTAYQLDFVKNKRDGKLPLSAAIFMLNHCPNLTKVIIPDNKHPAQYMDYIHYLTHCMVTIPRNPGNNLILNNSALAVFLRVCARNRLLRHTLSNDEWQGIHTVDGRHRLQEKTGEIIANYFIRHGDSLNLDFVAEYLTHYKAWKNIHFDVAQPPSSPFWEMAQLTEMGTWGIEQLFQHIQNQYINAWDNILQEPKPKLNLLFSITGNSFEDSNQILTKIKEKILHALRNSNGCKPIFNSLGLMLPDNIAPIHDSLIALFDTLDSSLATHQDEELREICLHNITSSDSHNLKKFLEKLEMKASSPYSALSIMVRIPQLDRECSTDSELCELQALYRKVQNLILNNQRLGRQNKFKQQTEIIHLPIVKDEKVVVQKNHKMHLPEQPWDEKQDTTYTLAAQTPGIQQQLQQAVEQEMEQQVEQEIVIEQEYEQEIGEYHGGEKHLITRNNIDALYADQWQNIPVEKKLHSGWQGKNLKQLFSLWVGSDRDAPKAIVRIEPEALEQMMEHAAVFRLGISRDNLPAGFKLYYSKEDGGIILGFNKKVAAQELKTQAEGEQVKKNPFTVKFYTPKTAQFYRGDYRQFATISPTELSQKQVYRFLATTQEDAIHLSFAARTLQTMGFEGSAEDASVHMQHYAVTRQFTQDSLALDECYLVLTKWALQKNPAYKELSELLFNPLNVETALNQDNLKAFGQLLYDHEVVTNNVNASDHFFKLAQHILSGFGKEHFSTWKKYFLNPSANYKELLDKDELTSVIESIKVIGAVGNEEGSKPLQNMWWQLVKAQGEATGFARYAPLWNSFNKLITYVNKYKLEFNEQAFIRYLLKEENFNGQVFLDRLYRTLRDFEKSAMRQEAQQHLLDHIDEADWTHSGVYYAAHYEHFHFWFKELGLTQFTASNRPKPSYIPDLDDRKNFPKSTDQLTACERFLCTQRTIYFGNYVDTHSLLKEHFSSVTQEPNGFLILRLWTACVSIGTDRISEANPRLSQTIAELTKSPDELLFWLNSILELGGETKETSFYVNFNDLPGLFYALNETKYHKNLASLSKPEALAFINSCGQALKCFQNNYVQKDWLKEKSASEQVLAQLLKKAQVDAQGMGCLKITPWLFTEYANNNNWIMPLSYTSKDKHTAEVEILIKQLQSIDFEHSTFLPSHKELVALKEKISSARDRYAAKQCRKEGIKALIEKGCQIGFQDAPYRPLTTNEQKDALEFLQKHLKFHFKPENINLATQFFSHYLAVSVDGITQHKTIERFLDTLLRINNKAYYNDLGQVLGTLINTAKSQKNIRYYSIEQLTDWLNILSQRTDHNQHFPREILVLVLKSQDSRAHNATLVNNDLHQLQPNIENNLLRDTFNKIMISPEVPQRYKAVLAQYALNDNADQLFLSKVIIAIKDLHQNHKDSSHIYWICEYIKALPKLGIAANRERHNTLREITKMLSEDENQKSQQLWQESQVKLIQLILKTKIEIEDILSLFQTDKVPDDYDIRCILLRLIDIKKFSYSDVGQLIELKNQLRQQSREQLMALSLYCADEPVPSATYLSEQLSQGSLDTNKLIHDFESRYMALDSSGVDKRHYSVTSKERGDLLRVFGGIQQKGVGAIKNDKRNNMMTLLYYTNNYSQVANLANIKFSDLKRLIHEHRRQIISDEEAKKQKSLGFIVTQEIDEFAPARLLACMREVLIRKSGKWVNHTQMLDLLYAAMHDNEKLLHQVRTGQGKSIISMMRVSYLALKGNVVDLFSSKDSLSRRDQEEFSHVLNAMDIPNSYITPNSPAETYKTRTHVTSPMGAVNFSTIGNSSLFHATQIWEDKRKISLDPSHRVAFIDECDFVLKFENTQFNFSANSDDETIYNFDEWVYRTTYKYYRTHLEQFPRDKNGNILISRNIHLKELCEDLQRESLKSPEQSTFMMKYIYPATQGHVEAVNKRNTMLIKLLSAAHTAEHLQEGSNFSIRSEQQILGESTVIDTRFAKVLIGNQIKHGSTYSDLIQQFLHVRLNTDAINHGDSPNFFVEPDSFIALSSNAEYTLKKYYEKIEGCTGTAGDLADLHEYEEKYGITHVVKLPSHEELRTNFLGSIYAKNYNDQIQLIIKHLLQYDDRPILVTCEDDIEVKRIYDSIQEALANSAIKIPQERFIKDTNDSGLTENEVVPHAGAAGKITISARMGRGTDIKPETKAGLMVLRTYPALPQITKQELGRQGRNGAQGTCIDILNFGEIEQKFKHYEHSPHKERLQRIMREQKARLELKFAKHHTLNSKKWEWLENGRQGDGSDRLILQDQYLKTRTLAQLSFELRRQQEWYLRRKESLLAILSGEIRTALDEFNSQVPKNKKQIEQFKTNWLATKDKVVDLWGQYMSHNIGQQEENFKIFMAEVDKHWKALINSKIPKARKMAVSDFLMDPEQKVRHKHSYQEKHALPQAETTREDVNSLISFYQAWVADADKLFFRPERAVEKIIGTIYGRDHNTLNQFYATCFKGSQEGSKESRVQLFNTLNELSRPAIFCIPLENWNKVLLTFINSINHEHFKHYLKSMEEFFKWDFIRENPNQNSAEDLIRYGLLFEIIMRVSCSGHYETEQKNTPEFLRNLAHVIHHHFWRDLNAKLAQDLIRVFSLNSSLFAEKILSGDFHHFIELINQHKFAENHLHDNRLNALGKYLTNHEQALTQGRQGVTRAIFNITLEGTTQGNTHDIARADFALPAPELLAKLPGKDQIALWNFLAQRQPLKAADIGRLTRLLIHGDDLDVFREYVLKPLTSIPPYVSLEYIINHLDRTESKSNHHDMNVRIKGIIAATKKLNEFGVKANIIPSEKEFHHIMNEFWPVFVKEFHKNPSPQENANFFEELKKYTDPVDVSFVAAFINNNLLINKDLTDTHRDFLAIKSTKLKSAVWDKFKNAPADDHPLKLAIHLKKHWPKNQLDESYLLRIFNRCIQDHHPIDSRLDYLIQAITRKEITSLAPQKKKLITDNIIDFWIKNSGMGAEVLNEWIEVLDILSKTQQGLQKDEQFSHYFQNFNQHRDTRKTIMQLVHHDIVTPEDFSILKMAPQLYRDMCTQELSLSAQFSKLPRALRNKEITKKHQNLYRFSEEVKQIIRINAPNAAQANRRPNNSDFFARKEKEYQSMWGKNRERKQQAQTLFTRLNDIQFSGRDGTIEYYTATLNCIWTTQQTILESDEYTNRNKKGYSRLYDITVELAYKLMTDFLADEDASLKDKGVLLNQLEQQLEMHIRLLLRRLPDDHILKNFAFVDIKDTSQLYNFKKQLTQCDRKSIPKHLHYLVENIERFIVLDTETKNEQPRSLNR